jgi:hypothetical protein
MHLPGETTSAPPYKRSSSSSSIALARDFHEQFEVVVADSERLREAGYELPVLDVDPTALPRGPVGETSRLTVAPGFRQDPDRVQRRAAVERIQDLAAGDRVEAVPDIRELAEQGVEARRGGDVDLEPPRGRDRPRAPRDAPRARA